MCHLHAYCRIFTSWSSCPGGLRPCATVQVRWSQCITGYPVSWASQMCTIRSPAKTGFHVSCSFFITGPPAVSGFTYIHTMASSGNRLPCVRRSLQWASHVVGLPSCTPCGLRHGPASMHFTVSSSPGLPLSRASPSTSNHASGADRRPCVRRSL